MSVLEVRGLRKHFGGVRAVDGVDFSVAAGELVALIGPNGAGKSTCFNVVNGQVKPDSGNVFLKNKEITGLPPRQLCRLGVGRTFQVAQTFASMTVQENVELVGSSNLLKQVGMEGRKDDLCSTLAYGDLKRVELALALATRPRLLLMDEPTAGMAAEERQALMILIKDLSKQDGIAVLFTEHDMDVVFGFADRVLVLHDGKLIAGCTPDEVQRDPRVREVYLGDA